MCMPRGEEHRKVPLCGRKPHARFDEGGLVKVAMARPFRHRQTKGTETDKSSPRRLLPALYSTPFIKGNEEEIDTWRGSELVRS